MLSRFHQSEPVHLLLVAGSGVFAIKSSRIASVLGEFLKKAKNVVLSAKKTLVSAINYAALSGAAIWKFRIRMRRSRLVEIYFSSAVEQAAATLSSEACDF